MDFRQGEKKDSVEFDYVFDATQGALSPSACGRERCWLFTENELQVFRLSGSSRGSRIFKWIFETPAGAETTVRFVIEVTVRHRQYLLVSLGGAADAHPEMRLLDLRTGQCVTSFSLRHSGRALTASCAVQVPQNLSPLESWASFVVGTDGGCLYAIDLQREAPMHGESTDNVWRVHETLLNKEQVEQRNLFKYRESVMAKQRCSVTSLHYITELPGFAVGFSFSAFEVYGKDEISHGYKVLGSSAMKAAGDTEAVIGFAFQQRFDGHLWVIRGGLPGSLSRSIASASLFSIPSVAKESGCALEDSDMVYTRSLSCEVAAKTASSRLLHCGTLPSRRGEREHSDFLLLVWEAVAVLQGSHQTELHLEVFSLRSSTVLDSTVLPSEQDCFTRFTVSNLSLASGNFDVARSCLAAMVLPSSVDDYAKRYGAGKADDVDMGDEIEMHDSRGLSHSPSDAPLCVSFDVALLSTEDVVTYRLAGPVPAALERLASTPLDEESIQDHYETCVDAGLLQGETERVAVEEQWRSVLGVLLDHSMVSVVCQYLVSEQHTLRPGLVYDWVQAEAAEVVQRYSVDSENALEERRQQEMDEDYTRLADCFSVMRALLTLQPSSGGVTSDTLRTLQFIEIHSWLSQLTIGEHDRDHLEQQCYTLAQSRKARKKPQKLFLERIMKSLKATIGSRRGDDDAMDEDEGYLSSSASFTYVYPVDIRRLIRRAAPEVMMTKRCLIFYYLLDLASIDKAMANAPEEFADAFMLPNAYRKAMKSLWILDCSDWENYLVAAELLSEFWTDKRRHNEAWAQEILSWAGDILSAFLKDSEYRQAHLTPQAVMDDEAEGDEDRPEPEGRLRAPLLFYYAAQPNLEEKELETALLAILFGSNDPIQDGFAFQRRMLRRPLSSSQAATAKRLLFVLYDFSQKRGLLDVLFLHHMDDLEERSLVEYFTTTEGLDFLLVYYLQRCRYQEAFEVEKALTAAGAHDSGRSQLMGNVKHLVQPFEESPSFAKLHTAVLPLVGTSCRAAKIVPGWTGPPAASAASQDEAPFATFSSSARTPAARHTASTPATVVMRPNNQAVVGTGQRINRFLQTPANTPLSRTSGSFSAQRSVRRQLVNTPFQQGGGPERLPEPPTLSPFLGTPKVPYHVPFGSTPGDLTPAFDRTLRPHNALEDDL